MNRTLHVYTNVILSIIAVALIALVVLFFTSSACAVS